MSKRWMLTMLVVMFVLVLVLSSGCGTKKTTPYPPMPPSKTPSMDFRPPDHLVAGVWLQDAGSITLADE